MVARAEGTRWPEYAGAAAWVAAVTLACYLVRSTIRPADVAMLYLLGVVIVAVHHSRGPSLLASVLSIALFDLVFVPPYGRWNVHDTSYFLTFAMMLVVAVIMSHLASRVRDAAVAAEDRERRTAALFALSEELGSAATPGAVADILAGHLEAAVAGDAAVALLPPGAATLEFPSQPPLNNARCREAAAWALEHGRPAGRTTADFSDCDTLLMPIRTPHRDQGVAAVRGTGLDRLATDSRRTLELLVRQAGLALERLALAAQRERDRVTMEGERLRTTLLSSLSHDLRSPLAGIEGAGTALLDPDTAADPHARAELAAAVVEESRRMARLITNLLDMMRIETGVPAVQRAWVPVEELIGVARLRVDERLARHPVTVHLPADLPLVPVDEILVEQALVNLLENAARHTPSGTPVSIGAWVESGSVVVEVADRGPGIPPGLEEEVFRKFYRGPGADDTGSGSGLGLAICRGVVAAHGGRIWAENSPLGGAAFRFTIPLDPAATGNSVEAIMTAVTDGAWAGRP